MSGAMPEGCAVGAVRPDAVARSGQGRIYLVEESLLATRTPAAANWKMEVRNMGWIIALIVGGIAGWLASLVMNRDASMGIFWNIVVGCVGSVIGNLIAGFAGISGSVQEFSITGLVIAVVGAIVLLGIVNLIQRGKVR